MPAQQLDQVGDRDTEDRAGEASFEAGDQRRDVAAERKAVQPDLRLRLLRRIQDNSRRMSHTA